MQSTQILRGVRFDGAVSVFYGKVAIYDNFSGYKLIDDRTGTVVDDVNASAAIRKDVRAFWLSIENAEGVSLQPGELRDALRVIEQFIRIGSPFIIPCDRHDMATLTSSNPGPTVYLHETVPGGIGIAEKMFQVWGTVLGRGTELARACDCADGCARCIHPPRYRAAEAGALRKSAGFGLARDLLRRSSAIAQETFDPATQAWRS